MNRGTSDRDRRGGGGRPCKCAHLLIRLDDDRDLAGREKKFHRIGLTHDAGHAGRQAVRRLVVLGRGIDSRFSLRGVLGRQGRSRRRTGRTSAPGGAGRSSASTSSRVTGRAASAWPCLPDSCEIRKLGQGCPVHGGRRLWRIVLGEGEGAQQGRHQGWRSSECHRRAKITRPCRRVQKLFRHPLSAIEYAPATGRRTSARRAGP